MPFGARLRPAAARGSGCGRRARATVELALERRARRRARAPCGGADGGWYELDASRRSRRRHALRYRIDGGLRVPDPASRYNPDDVHGASEVVDPLRLRVARRRLARPAVGRGRDLRAARRHLHARGHVRRGDRAPRRSRRARRHRDRADAGRRLSRARAAGATTACCRSRPTQLRHARTT